MVGVATRKELQERCGQDVRKVLITTIHKFGEAGGKLNERSNIIVMVDEAHRTAATFRDAGDAAEDRPCRY
jgi:type I restriction enzyme R subunit